MTHLYGRVAVPMRDGVELAGLLFQSQGERAPTLLVRSPYDFSQATPTMPDLITLMDRGYNVLWVSCRGLNGSQGHFGAVVDEIPDGYDTVDWIIAQPWSDGRVGTYGGSYNGMTQWAIVASGHPALKAVAPAITAMNWYRAPWYHPGGALSLSLAGTWHAAIRASEEAAAVASGSGSVEQLTAIGAVLQNRQAAFEHTPAADHPVGIADERLQRVLANPDFGDAWKEQDFSLCASTITAPVLMTAGWFDLFVVDQLRDFERIVTQSPSESVRTGSRLIVGPWAHMITESFFPAVDFGAASTAAAADVTGEHLQHFARWLPVGEPGPANPMPVKLFVMGIDRWREEPAWPLPDTQYTDHFLDTSTSRLVLEPPSEPRSIGYDYDPRDAVPTRGGAHTSIPRQDGPVDQSDIELRKDVVSFTSDVLDTSLEVIGYVRATLYVSSDARDTDFTAKLVDVHPDGTALSVCDGIIRARYRAGLDTPALMEPDEVYEVEIDMAPTAMVFATGHRVRVDISSSNFPRFDRNTNTGGFISRESIQDSLVAHNTIYSGPGWLSRITLPLIRR